MIRINPPSTTLWQQFLKSLKKRETTAGVKKSGQRTAPQPEALEGRIAPAAVLTLNAGENATFAGDGASDNTSVFNFDADFTGFYNSGGLTTSGFAGADVVVVNANEVRIRKSTIDGGTITFTGGGGTDDILFNAGLQNFDGLSVDYDTVQSLPALSIGGGGLFIQATAGGLVVGGDITKTSGGAATAELLARDSIVVSGGADIVSTSNSLNVTLNADRDADGSGGVFINSGGTVITTLGGNFTIGGGASPGITTAFGPTDKGVYIDGATISTGAGNVSIRGRGDAVSGGGASIGIDLANGTSISTTTGSISLVGIGGAAGDNFSGGISLFNGSSINTTSGAISLDGTTSSSGTDAFGVKLETNSLIQTAGSTVSIVGTSSSFANGGNNVGVQLKGNSDIVGGSSGSTSISGTGGGSSSGLNFGIELDGAGTSVTATGANLVFIGQGGSQAASGANIGVRFINGAQVQNSTGNINITGTGGTGSGGNHVGVTVQGGADIVSTGSGIITVTGNAGPAGTLSSRGITVEDAGSTINAQGSGALNLFGTGSSGTSIHGGLAMKNSGAILAPGGAPITIVVDSAGGADSFVVEASAGTISGTGALTIRPANASTTIGVGSGSVGVLNLDSADLSKLANGFSSITIGTSVTGNGAVDIRTSLFQDDLSVHGGTITVTGLNAGSNNVSLTSTVGPIQNGGDVATDITGGVVTLLKQGVTRSADFYGIGGNPGTDGWITVDATTVSATAQNGSIALRSAGTGGVSMSLTQTNVFGPGNLFVQGATEDVTITNATAPGGTFLLATITGFNLNVTGVTVDGGSGIGLSTVTSGNITVGSATSSGGPISVTAAGDITVNGPLSSATTTSLTGVNINGAGNIAATGGTTLSNTGTGTLSGVISGGALTKTGTGTLTLSNVNTYSGNTNVSNGTLQLSGGANRLPTGTSVIIGSTSSGAAFDLNGQNQAISALTLGVTGGSGAFAGNVTTGAGTLTVNGNISTANVNISNTHTIAGNLNLGGGTPTITVVNGGPATDLSITAVITNGGFTKAGAGTLTLSGANNFGGGTAVSAGTLNVNSASALGSGGVSVAATLVFNAAATYANNISGAGSITSAVAGNVVITGNNSFNGTYTINSGNNLIFDSLTALSGAPAVVDNGTLYLGSAYAGGSATISSLSGTGGVNSAFGATAGTRTLVVNQTATTTLSGAIVDASGGRITAITKSGTGTLTLTGTNTYTGATLVNGGVLRVNGSVTSNVTVTSPGTFGGSGTVTGNVSGNGTVAPGNSPGILTITGNFTPTGTVALEVNSPYTTAGTDYDQISVGGTVDLSGATLSITGGAASASALQMVTLINKTSAGATVASASPAQGATVTLGSASFKIFYNGGDGNNVVLVDASTPTVVYAEDTTWSALTPGTVIADADFGTAGNQPAIFGVNAFNTIGSAISAVTSSGQIVVNDGTYGEAVSLNGTKTLTVTTGAAVTLNSFTSIAGTTTAINGTTLTVGDATSTTAAGLITGSGGLTKQGAGRLTLSNPANTFSGNVIVQGGFLQASTGHNDTNNTSAFGLPVSAGRTITVGSGATLEFAANDVLGNATASPTMAIIANGGTITNTGGFFNTLGPVTLNAGTLNAVGGALSTYQAWRLFGTVTVGGAAASTISGSGGNSGIHLHSSTIFDVADATGNSNPDLIISGVLIDQTGSQASAAGALVKNGAGTVVMTGANTFSGGSTLNAGTLQIGTGSTTGTPGTGSITLSGGTLALNRSDAPTFSNSVSLTAGGNRFINVFPGTTATLSGAFSGGGELWKDGTGTLVLSNATNAHTNSNVINAGVLEIADFAALGGGNLFIGAGGSGTLRYTGATATTTKIGAFGLQGTGKNSTIEITNAATTLTLNAVVGNNGAGKGFTKTGAGTLLLSGANTFDGGIAFNGGVVSTTSDGNLGAVPGAFSASHLSFDGGTLKLATAYDPNSNRGITISSGGATIDASGYASHATVTLNQVIAGTGPLTLRSTGDVSATGGGNAALGIDLRATNTFTGALTITSGLVAYTADAAFGNAANTITLNGGGLLDPGRNVTMAHNVIIGAGGGTIRVYGATTATLSGSVSGSGSVNKTDGGTLILSGALNSFSGTFNDQVGNTTISGAGVIGGNWALSSGTTLTVTSASAQSIAGTISGAGAVTKAGAGTLTLSGPNSYAGATAITAGTVLLGNATALGTTAGATTITSGATLDLNGQTTAENITTAGTGVGALGAIVNTNAAAATVSGTITNSGSTVGVAAGNITFSGSVNGNTLTKIGAGTLILSGATDNNSLILDAQAGTVNLDKAVGAGVRAVAGIANIASGATVRLTGANTDQIFGGSGSGANGLVNMSAGGTLDLNGKSESFSRLTGAGTVTSGVVGAVTLTLGETDGTGATFTGAIQNGTGTVALMKIGTGTQTLGGASNYSGGTTISAGTLIGDNNTAFGTATITLNDASTAANNTSVLLVNSVDIANTVTVANFGTGISTIGSSGAGLALNPTTFSGTITLNKATTFSGTATDRLAIDGQVTGSVGTLTVSGGSRTTLQSTSNNFVGNILITGAGSTLQASVATAGEVIPNATNVDVGAGTTFMLAGSAGATETINALTGSGTVTRNVAGAQTLTVGSAGGGGTFSGTMNNGSGTVAFTKIGAGTQTLSGTGINFGGATTVSNGRLILSEATSHGNGASTTSFSIATGATLEFNVTGTHNIGSTSGPDGILISGGGTLQKTGVGLLALGNQGTSAFKLTMAMTTGGLIDVQGGAIRNGGWQGQVWTNNKADLNIATGATFDIWDGTAVIVDALTGAGALNRGIAGTSTITVGADNGSGNFTGNITVGTGDVAITKIGTGNQTLSGTNTYGGATTVSAGTLTLGSSSALGGTGGATSITSGATLDLNGQTTAENITTAGTGVGALGAIVNTNAAAATVSGTITNSGSTVGVAAGNITFSGSVNTNTLTKIGAGTLILSGATDNTSLILDAQAGTVNLDKAVGAGVRAVAGIANIASGATVRLTGANTDQIFGGSGSGANGLVNMSAGGTLDLNGKSESFSRLTGAGTVTSGVAGAVTLTLGETDGTGAVFAGLILNGSGTMSLTKIGTGTQTISGTGSSTNTASGLLQVSAGTLIVGAGFAGDGGWQGDVTINNAATLQLAQSNIFNNGSDWTINAGGTFNMNSQTDAIGNIAGGGAISNNSGGGLFLDDISGTKTYTGTINGTSPLTLRGNVAATGTQEFKPLTATTSTVSNLIVQRGTLVLGGAGTVTVSGNLSVGQVGAAGGNLTIQDTVTVGVTSGEFLIGDASTIPGFVTQTGGTVNIGNRVRLGHWPSGTVSTYTMSGGSLNVTNALNVGWDGSATFTQTGGTVSAATVAIDGNGVTGTAVETYTLQGGTLNVGTGGIVSADGAAGYALNLGGGTAPVLRATGNFTSGLNATLSGSGASAITIDTNGFTVGLSGILGGTGGLTKTGANVLTLSGANTFSGATAVNVGTLTAGSGSALGTAAGSTTVASGATLNVNGQNLGAEIVNIAGTGVGGLGALVNNGADQTQSLRFINLTADATVGGTGRFDIRTNGGGEQLDLAGFTLTKVGTNQFSVVGTNVTNGNMIANAGTLAIETGSTVAGTGTITVNAATLAFYANTGTFTRPIVLNSGAVINEPGSGSTATVSSPITLNANVAINSGANTTLVLNGVITDGASTFGYTKGGAGTLTLAGANTYDGTTTVSAGTLQIGNGGTSGSVGTGAVVNNGSLHFRRSDATSFGNTVTGTGTIRQLDGSGQVTITGSVTQANVYAGSGSSAAIATANPLVLSGTSVLNVSGILGGTTNEAGMGTFGKFVIQSGASVNTANLWLGEQVGRTGEVQQDGGTVIVSAQMRVGHWGSNTSTYTINGGTLSLTGTPAGGTEQNGILYVGIDGTGIFNQTGGTVTAPGMVLDNRGDTAGTDTYTMTGGTLILGSFGLSGNASTQVNLQGGTVRASASFTASLPVTFTGGSTTIDTNGFDITLSNALSGSGNFNKINGGALNVTGTSTTYSGTGSMTAGTANVTGSLGASATFAVNGGTLIGTGTVGTLNVNTGGTVNPGTVGGVGTFNTGTLNFNGGTYAADLIGTGADKITVTTAVNVNGGSAGAFSLNNAAGTIAPNTVFTFIENNAAALIANPPLTGAAEGGIVTVDGKTARYTYLGGVGGNDFTLTVDGSLTIAGTAAADNFEIRRIVSGPADNIQVLLGGLVIDSRPTAAYGGGAALTINAGANNDNLFVNYGASGGIYNFAINYNGEGETGSPGDSLTIGGASVTTVTHNFINNNDGNIVVVDGAGTRTINYTGLEPIVDNLNAVNRVFSFSGATETITLTNAGAGTMTIDSNVGGESVTFANPTTSLTIDGGAGDDTVTLTSLSATYTGSLTVNGGANTDVINIATGFPTLSAATFTAETINAATLTTVGTQSYTGAVQLAGATSLTSSTGGILVNGTVNGARALSLSAVAGNISVTGAIGGIMPLTSLTTNSATVGALPAITAGAITITATAGGIAISSATAVSGGISMSAASDIVVGSVSATGQTVTLTADSDSNGTGGIFGDGVAATNVIADTLIASGSKRVAATPDAGPYGIHLLAQISNLTATANVANIASDTAGIFITNTGALNIISATANSAVSGSINISATGQLTVGSITQPNGGGDIDLSTTTGDILLGSINTPAAAVSLSTSSGAIVDNNGAVTNVLGGALYTFATTGVGAGNALETTVSSFYGQNSAGNMEISNTGSLIIDTTGVTISGGSGSVLISAASPVTVNSPISAPVVFLSAGESAVNGDNLTINATVTSTVGSVTLEAGDDIDVNQAVTSATSLTATAGVGNLDSAGQITVLSTGSLTASAGTVSLNNTVAGVTLEGTVTASGLVAITSRLDVTVSAAVTSTGGDINIAVTGPTGQGADIRGTAGGSLNANNLTMSVAGNDGRIGFVTGPFVALNTNANNIVYTAPTAGNGEVTIREANGATITGSSGSGDVNLTTITGNWTIVSSGVDATGIVNVTASAGDILRTGGSADITGTTLTLTAGGVDGDIGVAATRILTSGTTVRFTGTGTGEVAITESNGATVSGTTGSGVINLTSTTGDWTVDGNITTTGNVTMTASAGDILRTAGTVTGNLLTFAAGGADGDIGASGAPIQTTGTSIVFTGTVTGDVFITESNGANVSGSTGSGQITLVTTTGNWTLNSTGVDTTGNVTMTALAGDVLRQSGFLGINADVTGNLLTFNAGGIDGDIGDSGAPLATSGTTIAFAGTGTGEVYITESNGATISGSTGSGDIFLTTTTGDWTFGGSITTTGSQKITALAGDIIRLAGIVSGSNLSFTAGGPDGDIGSVGSPIATTGSAISFSGAGTGDVFITESDGSTINGVTGSGNINLVSTTGTLTFDGNITTTGDVFITAVTGALARSGGVINADDLVLTAALGIGTAIAPVQTNVTTITTTSGGDQFLNETNGVAVNLLNAGTANITLTNVTGAVTDNNGAANNFAASNLTIVAPGGITNIETAVTTLTATTSNTNISIDELDSVALNLINAGSGDVTLRAGGSITDNNAGASNVNADELTIQSTSGIDIDTMINTLVNGEVFGLGNLRIDDLAGGLNVTAATTAGGTLTITATGGDLNVTNANSSDALNLQTITSGDIRVGTVTAGTTATLTSAGRIDESATPDAAVDITAAALVASAATGIGTNSGGALETEVSTLNGATNTGGIFIDNNGALNVTGLAVATSGNITLNNYGDDDGLTVTVESDITVNGPVSTPGNVTIIAHEVDDNLDTPPPYTNNITVNSTITGNLVTLRAGDDLIIASTGVVTSTGLMTLVAGYNDLDSYGNVVLNGLINPGGGLVLTSFGDIVFGSPAGPGAVINAPGAAVTLTSTNGNIYDNNDNDKPSTSPVAPGFVIDVIASVLTLNAPNGYIGEDGDTIETNINTIIANAGDGGLFLWNTAALTVAAVTTAGATTTAIDVTSEGSMTVNGPVTDSGAEDINFFATGVAANLTLNGTVTGAGDMTFQAGNVINIGALGVINNTGTETVTLDAGWPDSDPGLPNNVSADLTISGALNLSAASLRLTAPRHVVLSGGNADITTTGTLTVVADRDSSAVGTGGTFRQTDIDSTVQVSGVDISAADVELVGTIDAGTGDISVIASISASPIYMNNTGVGLNLSLTDLLSLRTVGGEVTIGDAGNLGTVFIGGLGTVGLGLIDANYTINGGAIDFNGGIVLADNRTLTLNATLSGLITTTGGGVTDVVISGAAGKLIVNASGNVTLNTRVTNLGESSINGDFVLNNTNTNLTVIGDVDALTADITVGTGTFGVATGFTFATDGSASGNFTITADGMTLDGTLDGGGVLTLRGNTVATTFGFGDGATGMFNMTYNEVGNILDGFDKIIIGRTGQTGNMHFIGATGTEVTFADPVQIIGGTGQVTIEETSLTGIGDASFDIDARRLVFTGTAPGVVTDDEFIDINAGVVLESNVTIDSTAGGAGGGADGDVTFIGTINGAFDLTVLADAGDILFAGNPTPVPSGISVGGEARLTSVTASGAKITLHCNIYTSGDQTYTGTEIVMSNGDRLSATGDLTFNGPTTVTRAIRSYAPAGSITFNGDVNSGPAGTGALTLIADSVSFLGDVGNIQPLAALNVSVSGALNIGGDFTADDLIVELNEINFLGGPDSVTIPGVLEIKVKDAGTAFRVGGLETDLVGGAPTLNFSDDDIAALADGISAINLIQTGPTDLMVVAEAGDLHFLDPLTLRHTAKSGIIQIKGDLYGDTANGSITTKVGSTGATVLEGSVFTTGGGKIDIFNGRVADDIALNTSVGGGDVIIRGKWAAALGGETLDVDAGAGDITIIGTLGIAAGKPPVLGEVTLTSSGNTTFGTSLNAQSLVVNGGGITKLGGAVITTGSAGQVYNNPVQLAKSAGLTSKHAAGAIVFGSTIDSIAPKLNSLTITNRDALAGTTVVDINGAVGAAARLGTFRINTKGDAIVSGDIFAKGVAITAAEFTVENVDTVIADTIVNSQSYRGIANFNGAINSERLTINATGNLANSAAWTVSGLATINTDKDSDIVLTNFGPANVFGELSSYAENISIQAAGNTTLKSIRAFDSFDIDTTGTVTVRAVRAIEDVTIASGGSILQTGAIRARELFATAAAAIQLDNVSNYIQNINAPSAGTSLKIVTASSGQIGLSGTISAGMGNIVLAATRGSFIYAGGASISVAGGYDWTMYTTYVRTPSFDLDLHFGPDATELGDYPTPPSATGNVIVYRIVS